MSSESVLFEKFKLVDLTPVDLQTIVSIIRTSSAYMGGSLSIEVGFNMFSNVWCLIDAEPERVYWEREIVPIAQSNRNDVTRFYLMMSDKTVYQFAEVVANLDESRGDSCFERTEIRIAAHVGWNHFDSWSGLEFFVDRLIKGEKVS